MLDEQGILRWLLVDRDGVPVEIVGRFLRFLQNRQLSPNTVAAYARDLTLFFRFLDYRGLAHEAVGPALVVEFLDFLTHLPVRWPGKQQTLAVVVADAAQRGWPREAERHNAVIGHIATLLDELAPQELSNTDG